MRRRVEIIHLLPVSVISVRSEVHSRSILGDIVVDTLCIHMSHNGRIPTLRKLELPRIDGMGTVLESHLG